MYGKLHLSIITGRTHRWRAISACILRLHAEDIPGVCCKQRSQYRPNVGTISPTPAASKARTMQRYAFN